MNLLNLLKNISPVLLKKIARETRSKIFSFIDSKKPYLNKIKYFDYFVYYTRGAGLIERIRFGSTNRVYEPELIENISNELEKSNEPIFLDVGTNIGLISLAIAHKNKEVKIYGFEPSTIPFKTFSTTIFANELEDRIFLSSFALSNESGFLDFSVHGGRDSSGDGILDTKRSQNKVNFIKVSSTTLDEWWEKQSKPKINVIKIDIEGAELFALQGGVSLLRETQPVIFLEISKENLKVYPYKAEDIFSFFELNKYSLQNLSGVILSKENLEREISINDTFIAKPL